MFHIRDDSHVENTLELANVNQRTKNNDSVNIVFKLELDFVLDMAENRVCTILKAVFLFHVSHVCVIVLNTLFSFFFPSHFIAFYLCCFKTKIPIRREYLPVHASIVYNEMFHIVFILFLYCWWYFCMLFKQKSDEKIHIRTYVRTYKQME